MIVGISDTYELGGVPHRIEINVPGLPVPQGSMRGFVNRRTGKAALTSDNPDLKRWRDLVTLLARGARGAVRGVTLLGPVEVQMLFTLPRPASHWGRRGLRTWAPRYPIVARGDLDKLARAVNDSITAARLWRDDGQVVRLHCEKVYGPDPGVRIRIQEIPHVR